MDTPAIVQLHNAYNSGQYGRVIFLANQALKNSPPPAVRAAILLCKGLALRRSGMQGEAISCYREGIACAGKDRTIKTKLMAGLAAIFGLNGDHVACKKLMAEFERFGPNPPPDVMRQAALLYYNYGCTLDNAFLHDEAVHAYRRGAELAQQHGVTGTHGMSLHNLGGVLLVLGRLTEAHEAMTQAEAINTTPDWGCKQLSRRAEFALATGELMDAQQSITEALLHPTIDDFTRADIFYTWARVLLAMGRPQQAYLKAQQALEYAVKDLHVAGIQLIQRFLHQVGPLQ